MTVSGLESSGAEQQGSGTPDDYQSKVSALKGALKGAQDEYKESANSFVNWLLFWGIASFLAIVLLVLFSFFMFNFGYEETWSNREFLYSLVFRVLIALGIFTVVAFCIKMFRSHIYLYQYTMHKSTIVNSMASLLGSASNHEKIHTKLIDILLDFGNSGIEKKQKNDLDLKQLKKLIELLNSKVNSTED